MNTNYHPGDRVLLKDGQQGILYCHSASNRRNPLMIPKDGTAKWYFLPDRNQPTTISTSDIQECLGRAPGDWPDDDHLLLTHCTERQEVYVAHMKKLGL